MRPGAARRSKSFWVGGGLLFLGLSSVAWAQIRLTIPEPGGTGLPIAVSPLAPLGARQEEGLGERFAEVVRRDLALSGYFKVLDSEAYIEGPAGFTPEEIQFHNWSVLGAVALVKGAFSLEEDRLVLEARLFDVVQRKQLGGRRYRGKVEDWRRMAHRFADQILEYLTGERGPFESKIAFVARRQGRAKEVYVMDLSGEELVRVTYNRTLNLFPAWQPGAKGLLFFSYQEGGPYPYYKGLFSSTENRLLAGVSFDGEWSPDGRFLALSLEQNGNSDLFLVSPEGRVLRRLTDHPDIDVSPSWSPDGRSLAFCSSRSGSPQIYILGLENDRVRRLTFTGSYNTSPAWSPKGKEVAYTGRVGGRFAIFTIEVEGGEPRQLAFGEDPSWSPDGRYLVFSAARGEGAHLYIVTRDGRHIAQLTHGRGNDTNPSWSTWLQD